MSTNHFEPSVVENNPLLQLHLLDEDYISGYQPFWSDKSLQPHHKVPFIVTVQQCIITGVLVDFSCM